MKKIYIFQIVFFLLIYRLLICSADEFRQGDWSYETLEDGTVRIIEYRGEDAEVVVPSVMDWYSVSELSGKTFSRNKTIESVTISEGIKIIGSGAFAYCSNLSTINLPNSIISIGGYAFSECKSLSSVVIPDGITTLPAGIFSGDTNLEKILLPDNLLHIQSEAFYGCSSLTTINFPDTLVSIEDRAFRGCEMLSTVKLPEKLTQLGNDAFSESGLNSIILPTSLEKIGDNPFRSCKRLTGIQISEKNQVYCVKDNVLFNDTERTLISYPAGLDSTHYIIPDGTIHIGPSAFYEIRRLNSVIFPEGLLTIDKNAFRYCSITNLALPSTLQTIGESAFFSCYDLQNIEFPESLQTIEKEAFGFCKALEIINLPEGLQFLGDKAFNNCEGIKAVYLPASLKCIDVNPFPGCLSLSKLEFNQDNQYYSIENNILFDRNKRNLLVYPAGIPYAYYTVPNGVERVGDHAFAGCENLMSITIPDSVTMIDAYAFSECRNLNSIRLSEKLEELDSRAFFGTDSLSYLVIPSSVSKIKGSDYVDTDGNYLFTMYGIPNNNKDFIVFAEEGSFAEKWAKENNIPLSTIIETNNNWSYDLLPDGTARIRKYKGNDKNVTIPDYLDHHPVTEIGNFAFYGRNAQNNHEINSIIIPETVTSIGFSAFSFCTELREILLPQGLKNISDDVFSYCKSLEKIIFPPNLTSLGNRLCQGCTNLKIVEFPKNLVSIGEAAFLDCITLEYIHLPEKLKEIGASAFQNDVLLKKVILSKNLSTIPESAFQNCNSLEEISLLDGLNTIKDSAFKDCVNLKEVTLPDSVTYIEMNSFSGTSRDIVFTLGSDSYAEEWAQSANLSFVYHPSEENPWLYEVIEDGSIRILGYNGLKTSVIIPSQIDGYPVSVIGEKAFIQNDKLTRVTISEGITTIEMSAFENCWSLSDVEFHEGLTYIGIQAFAGCALSSVIFPQSLTVIDNGAFMLCDKLTVADLPKNLEALGHNAFFADINLISVSIPEEISLIGINPFANCNSLEKIQMIPKFGAISKLPSYYVQDNVLFSRNEKKLISYPLGRSESIYEIPEGTKIIGERAFEYDYDPFNDQIDTNLKKVIFPSSVETIEESAFRGNEGLISVDFGDGLHAIEKNAFSDCDQISSIKFPIGLATVGDNAFYGCSNIETVTFHEGLVSIGEEVFAQCNNLMSASFPSSLMNFSANIFTGCNNLKELNISPENSEYIVVDNVMFNKSMTKLIFYPSGLLEPSYTIPEGIVTIGNSAFANTKNLLSVSMPDGLITIEDNAFKYSSLNKINFSKDLRFIGNEAFNLCNLDKMSLPLPDSLEVIGEKAFDHAFWLTGLDNKVESLHLPKSLKSLGKSAFENSSALTSVYLPSSLEEINGNPFSNCHNLETIQVDPFNNTFFVINNVLFNRITGELITYPAALSVEEYKAPDGTISIAEKAFSACNNLKTVILPEGVTTIQNQAFYLCENLTSISLPNSINEIETKWAFSPIYGAEFILNVKEDSFAEQWAVENGIYYQLF